MFDKKEANSKKTIYQEEAALASENANMILKWTTGTGKTRAAAEIMSKHLNIEKFFICVNEISHIKNWENELKEGGYQEILDKCEIFCYASLKKYCKRILKGDYGIGNSLFVFDEYHHISENRFQLLKTIPIYKFTALSATGTIESDYRLENLSGLTSFPTMAHIINPNKAIKEGIVPEPKVNIIKVKLSNKGERTETYIKKKGKTTKDTPIYETTYPKRWEYLVDLKTTSNYILNILCTKKEKYKMIEEDVEYAKKTFMRESAIARKNSKPEPIWAKNKWLRAASVRKQFIAHCKTDMAKNIINTKLKNLRFITFTGSINQCEELGKQGEIIHSKLSNKECENIIFNFNNYVTDRIFCVIKLREGQNLNGIQAGLVIQLDNQTKSFTQELGRVLRSSYPIFYVLVLEGTRDEVFFDTALAGLDESFINYINIE